MPALGAFDNFTPPLQTYEGQCGLGGNFAGAGEFMVERVEEQQRLSSLRRCEEGGEETVRVMTTDVLSNIT
jgi:hypothetical protein